MPFNTTALEELIRYVGSERQLARHIGVTKSTINRWRNGSFEPSASDIDEMYKYAKKIKKSSLEFYLRPTKYT